VNSNCLGRRFEKLPGAWNAKPGGAPLSFGESIIEAPSVGGLIAFGTIDRAEETARLSMSYPPDDLVRAIGLHPDCSALSESLTTYTFLYRPTSHSQEAEGGRPLQPAAGNRPRWFVRVVTPA
jgi:hypothetical protein